MLSADGSTQHDSATALLSSELARKYAQTGGRPLHYGDLQLTARPGLLPLAFGASLSFAQLPEASTDELGSSRSFWAPRARSCSSSLTCSL